jgi:hypothetical protein
LQPNIVRCFADSVKDNHRGAYPLLSPQFSRHFPPAVAKDRPRFPTYIIHVGIAGHSIRLLKYPIRHDSITINAFLEIDIGIACNWFVACTDQIPSLTFYQYRGYVIGSWARPELTKGRTSIGVVYKPDKFGSMIRMRRIKEQAEQHGLELCKEWIDGQFRV